MKKIHTVFLLLFTTGVLFSESLLLEIDVDMEMGFLGIIKHEIQSGTTDDKGDVFDYKSQGNQDTLFPFLRYQADIQAAEKHHLVLLYQPLLLETQAPIDESFRYDQVNYTPEDNFLNLIYSFDFWRFSYLYDWIEPQRGFFFSPGISFQIRNASILFRSDTGKGQVQDNIGPVPVIKLRSGYRWHSGFFILFDGDGFYASSKFINGADYPFTGYIYDLSLRGGYRLNSFSQGYLNLRFLGGGAEGTNDKEEYTFNDLHTFSFSLGLKLIL